MIVRRVAVALVVVSATALAQAPRPTVVVTPLELEPNPALTRFDKQLEDQFQSLVRDRAGVITPTKKETEHALNDLLRRDFRESKEALAQLAQKAGTLYALHVVISYSQKGVLALNGQVVRSDGKAMKRAQVQLPKGDDTIVSVGKVLALQLFKELALSSLSLTAEEPAVVTPTEAPDAGVPVAVAKPDAGVEFVPPPLPPPADEGEGQRTAGKVLVGTGAGVAAVGAVLGIIGLVQAGSVTPDSNGNIPPAQVRADATARVLKPLGLGLSAGGLALAAVGAVVWATAPAAPVKVVVVPTPGGVMVGLTGVFQ